MKSDPRQLDLERCGPDLAGYMQHLANQSLRPVKPQEPCDQGLFGNDAAQLDLIDQIKQRG